MAQAALRLHFADRRNRVYVACDTFVYYREGDTGAVVAPDMLVVQGVSGENRKSCQMWLEGLMPQCVLAVASGVTVREDLEAKKDLYRDIGVREYWQFGPTGSTLGRRLEGWALRAGRYEALRTAADGTAWSAGLGLEVQGELLRFRDPRTGLLIPTLEEEVRASQEAQQERDAAARKRRVLEAELAALRAQLAKPDGEPP